MSRRLPRPRRCGRFVDRVGCDVRAGPPRSGPSRGWPSALALGVAALVWLLAPPARAEPPGAARADAPLDGSTPLDSAARHLLRGDLARAAESLRRAHELDPRPSTLLRLAEVQAQLGRHAAAAASLESYLRSGGGDSEAGAVARAAELLARQRSLVSRLHLSVEPPGALVRIDGARIEPGREPALVLDPGVHDVWVALAGCLDQRFRLLLSSGEQARLGVRLDGCRGAGAPASDPAAGRSEDRWSSAASPASRAPRVGGRGSTWVYCLSAAGMLGAAAVSIRVYNDRRYRARWLPAERSLVSPDAEGDRAQQLRRRSANDRLQRSIQTWDDAALGLAVGGGAALAAAVGFYLWGGSSEEPGAAALAVSLVNEGPAVVVSGSF